MDRSDWTDADWADVTKYGMCWCGRPRRAHIERDADGTMTYAWMSCDIDGHGPDQRPVGV